MNKGKRILDSITRPSDVSCLDDEQLAILSSELREQIIETTSKHGGHIAPSLGAVDIILACHCVLDVPKDKLIFDVGHQSYAHMLLQGDLQKFENLREFGGQPGFPRPSVSAYDSNVAGHASDSLSIAAGYAQANLLDGNTSKVVAIIGDSSIEGGMALEALNYIGANQLPVKIILNDNGMSISKSVGAIAHHLGVVRTSNKYRDARNATKKKLMESGEVGRSTARFVSGVKNSIKQIVLPYATIFEKMGIMCTPPIDGNNVAEVRDMLNLVKDFEGPVIIHAITTKGKGYEPAERDPEGFHGVSTFDIATGEPLSRSSLKWTNVFGQEIVRLARENDNIVAITAAMEGGCGLKEFRKEFPMRFIDVGIAEENAVGIASGLAYAGKIPVVCIYSTFLQRAYDQIMIDVCLEAKHVVFAIDRAGLVGDDGPTHHGAFDIAYLRTMPNMTILTPCDEVELKLALDFAINECDGPVAVRYPRGTADHLPFESAPLQMGCSQVVKLGTDVAILSFGKMTRVALDVANALSENEVSARVVDMRFAKPLDVEAIKKACKTKLIATIEDGILQGGAGEAVASEVARLNIKKKPRVLNFGIDNKFVEHGDFDNLFKSLKLDASSISESILSQL